MRGPLSASSVSGRAAKAASLSEAILRINAPKVFRGLLGKQWKGFRKALEKCQAGFSEETVHELRVQIRRLLAAVELFEDLLPAKRLDQIESCLKHYLDTLGDLRDTQVQLIAVECMRRRFAAARAFHFFLLEREQRLIRKTRKAVGAIRTRRLRHWMDSCLEETEAGLKKLGPEKAGKLLLRSARRAFARTQRLAARINPLDTTSIHRLRVAFKKYRYMAEILLKCLPQRPEKQLEQMRSYQGLMGDIQDVEVLSQAIERFLCKHPIAPDSARRLQGELLRRRDRLVGDYLEKVEQLRDFAPSAGFHRATGGKPLTLMSKRKLSLL